MATTDFGWFECGGPRSDDRGGECLPHPWVSEAGWGRSRGGHSNCDSPGTLTALCTSQIWLFKHGEICSSLASSVWSLLQHHSLPQRFASFTLMTIFLVTHSLQLEAGDFALGQLWERIIITQQRIPPSATVGYAAWDTEHPVISLHLQNDPRRWVTITDISTSQIRKLGLWVVKEVLRCHIATTR